VPEPEIRLPEQDPVPNGAVVEESPAGQTGGATLQGRHDRNGGRRGLARGRSWISGPRLSDVTSIITSVMGSPKRRRPASWIQVEHAAGRIDLRHGNDRTRRRYRARSDQSTESDRAERISLFRQVARPRPPPTLRRSAFIRSTTFSRATCRSGRLRKEVGVLHRYDEDQAGSGNSGRRNVASLSPSRMDWWIIGVNRSVDFSCLPTTSAAIRWREPDFVGWLQAPT
jgi:hypothetical protein